MTTPEEIYEALSQRDPIYTTKKLADLLGVNQTTINLYAKYGLIGSRTLGNHRVFSFPEIMTFCKDTQGMKISNTEEGIRLAAKQIASRKQQS